MSKASDFMKNTVTESGTIINSLEDAEDIIKKIKDLMSRADYKHNLGVKGVVKDNIHNLVTLVKSLEI